MKLYDFIQELIHEQEIIVIDFDNGDVLIKNRNARSAACLLEHNERLRDAVIPLIEIEVYNSIMRIYIRKN